MKKLVTLFIALAVTFAVKAQWVDNPATNTFLANTSADAGEVYLSTAPNGDTYVQWSQFGPNSWSPTLQRLNVLGEPQWDNSGIHPSYHQMASWSQGFAMAATSDNAVVTCFSTEAGQTIAIKINPDGTYAWGEQGLTLFGGVGNSRTELLAGDDGGVWALGTDIDNGNLYVCYIEANGTMNPTITISDDGGKLCMFGLFVPTDDGVFVVYEKETWAYTYFYNKEIWVAGYNKNGEAISTPSRLMASQTIGGSYSHYVVPDGLGGGYAYIWHPAIGNAFNTYVFHFDSNGLPTIQEPDGVPVHTADPNYFYLDANATVDPVTHDLLITYIETDAEFQSLCRVYVNRITPAGYRVWNDGRGVIDNGTTPCSDLLIDAIPYGYGFTLIYNEGSYQTTVKAKGFDEECSEVWSKVMSSQSYPRAMCKNTTGFDSSQNIVAWVDNSSSGGLYGQNLGWEGSMGPNVTPIPPVEPCYPPTDFNGFYSYDSQCNSYGAELSWTAPVTTPLHYKIYRNCIDTGDTYIIELDADVTDYIDDVEIGDYIYRLTAVYEDCESDYALTASGDDYILIYVSNVPENVYEKITTVKAVYNLAGQRLNCSDLNDLPDGVYIVQGVTDSGKAVTQKIVK